MSSVEQATEAKQFVVLPVSFANGHVESIEVDAATTSTEMCSKLANKIGLKDLFGFSIFVSIFHKVTFPAHVFDFRYLIVLFSVLKTWVLSSKYYN